SATAPASPPPTAMGSASDTLTVEERETMPNRPVHAVARLHARPDTSPMLFEQLRSGGCLSYLVGCDQTGTGAIVDPALDLVDRYAALATGKGLRVRYVIDTHTHPPHFSPPRTVARPLHAPTLI